MGRNGGTDNTNGSGSKTVQGTGASQRRRRLATIALGVLFVLGFTTYLAVDLVQNRLLDDSLYTDALAENFIYHRIYTELLADPAMVEITAEFLEEQGLSGDLADGVLSLATSTLYLILPPPTIQAATENVIRGVTSYFRGETELSGDRETLRLAITESMDDKRVAKGIMLAAQAVIAHSIAEEIDEETPEGTPQETFELVAERLDQGDLMNLPQGLGNVRLDRLTRAEKIELAEALLAPAGDRATPVVKLQVAAALADNDLPGAVAAAAIPVLFEDTEALATALIDELESSGQLDGLTAAGQYFDETRDDVRQRMEEIRLVVSMLDRRLQPLAVLAMAVAMAGIVWLNSDDIVSLLRSAGVTLLVASGVVLILWFLARLYIEAWSPDVLQQAVSGGVPPSLQRMVRDVVLSIVPRIIGNLVRSTLLVGAVGAVLVVLSNIRSAVTWIDGQLARVWQHKAAVLVTITVLVIVVPAVLNAVLDAYYESNKPCNGHRELCDRRVDEVVFASTHNGMSVAELSWLWPSHDGDLSFQLDRGIRGLFIDTHYYDAKASVSGYLKDASPEVQQVVEDAIDLIGLETKEGTYLCHLLCHLGATTFVDALDDVRVWLDGHPNEVVVMVIEDKISAADTEAAFDEAGLVPYTYTYPGEGPWPTLQELIDDNQRLIVMAEVEGSPPAWYHHVWDYVGETPYKFESPDQFSCEPNRGGDGKPMLLMNHWIERVSPSRTDAMKVNDYEFLLARARQCEDERGQIPNFVSVNFFLSGDVIDVVDTLNGVGYRAEQESSDET